MQLGHTSGYLYTYNDATLVKKDDVPLLIAEYWTLGGQGKLADIYTCSIM